VGSNDDSKRIMPGETYVMADLRGPGVVSHIWITVADNECAWPRLHRQPHRRPLQIHRGHTQAAHETERAGVRAGGGESCGD
jgi:hypothetical protein